MSKRKPFRLHNPVLLAILELPKHGDGFSAATATTTTPANLDVGSASPPRKVIRLENDADIASTSRARSGNTGVVNIRILGADAARPKSTADTDRVKIKQFISVTLRKDDITQNEPYEKIYRRCRSLVCKEGRGESLFHDLKVELGHCNNRLLEQLNSEEEGIKWIVKFIEICNWFHDQVNLLSSTLAPLDQYYVSTVKGHLNVHNLAFHEFENKLIESKPIEETLRASIAQWAEHERTAAVPGADRHVVAELFTHLELHGQYYTFEQSYRDTTEFFYKKESKAKAEALKDQPEQFLKHVLSRIKHEIQCTKDTFPPMSWALIQETTEQALMEDRAEWIAKRVLPRYLDSNDMDAIATMYQLYVRIEQTKILRVAFREYLEDHVKRIVQDKDEDTIIDRLLTTKSLAERANNTAFLKELIIENPSTSTAATKRPDQDFVDGLRDAFNAGFKTRRKKPAEALARHLDKVLRKGQGSHTDSEYMQLLDSALSLCRHSDDKDVFRSFYHRQLAKRLLLGKSASDTIEKALLMKLKNDYDPEFDQAQSMFTDLVLAREMMEDYHSKLPEDSPAHKLMVTVLQTSAWPFGSSTKLSLTLPEELQGQLTAYYKKYYRELHKKRILTWDHSLGTMTLKARFKSGTKELSVSLFQGTVLLLFNGSSTWTFEDIKVATNLLSIEDKAGTKVENDDELRRTLQSLACGKKRVLKKVPMNPDIKDGDVFSFNGDFTDPRNKIHINSIQAKVSEKESAKAQADIDIDRRNVIDAAVVRIMKAKKEMAFELMINETIDAVKKHFKPEVSMIKKRVDALVEQEYLERSEKDRNVFKYLA